MHRPAILLALILVGCGKPGSAPPPPPPAPILSRDSAGVTIVEHPAGLEASLPEWVVDSAPLVDIGGSEAPGHDLHRVWGAALLRDGGVVVINAGTSELRFYDSTGRFLRSAGRSGQGPGEFEFVGAVQVLPGDTLLAMDGQLRRGSLWTPGGQVVRQIELGFSRGGGEGGLGGRYAMGVALLRTGSLLVEDRAFPTMRETSGPVRRDSFALSLASEGGSTADTIALVPGDEVYPAVGYEGNQEFPTIKRLEFGRRTSYVTDGERIFVGTNERWEIREYSAEGSLRRLIRSETPAEPVTEEARSRRVQETLDNYDRQTASEAVKAIWRKNMANQRFAETFPFHDRLMIGMDGTLWLERVRHDADEGRRFVVYDSAGRGIARVRCPDRMRPFVVSPDRIAGLWRDADDVEHVRVYLVRR